MRPSNRSRIRALPYGKWTCADGREVWFNRDYTPIFQRHHGKVAVADPTERVPFVKQEWFYDDGTSRRGLRQRLEQIVADIHAGE